MNHWQIATRSLFYFWRSNLAIALGVAAATAVLTGALIVGSSMRHSLKQLTLDRLGRIDEILGRRGLALAQAPGVQVRRERLRPRVKAGVGPGLQPVAALNFHGRPLAEAFGCLRESVVESVHGSPGPLIIAGGVTGS